METIKFILAGCTFVILFVGIKAWLHGYAIIQQNSIKRFDDLY